jgi:hypothetical protein
MASAGSLLWNSCISRFQRNQKGAARLSRWNGCMKTYKRHMDIIGQSNLIRQRGCGSAGCVFAKLLLHQANVFHFLVVVV